jgi:polysaccharide export outer membrane protein
MFSKKLLLLCSFLPLLLSLVGCAEEQFEATTDLEQFRQQYEEKQKDFNRGQDNVFSPDTLDEAVTGDYRLGSGDLLTVKVYESEELDTEVRVSSRGEISLPLLNNVDVFNLTAAEAENKVEELYRVKYIRDPHVIVYIKEHVSKQITLIGSVNKPGTYEYVRKRRLLDVLAIANGLAEKSGTIAYITREDVMTHERKRYAVNLEELLKRGNMRQNMVILGGDEIFIPESGQFFIDGAVRKPGNYALKGKMTITEALALAGGLASYADDDGIKLIRYMGVDRERAIVSLSYSDLQAGMGDTLFLQDQDVIFAESSSMGLMTSGSGFTIGFMGTGFTYKDPESNVQSK